LVLAVVQLISRNLIFWKHFVSWLSQYADKGPFRDFRCYDMHGIVYVVMYARGLNVVVPSLKLDLPVQLWVRQVRWRCGLLTTNMNSYSKQFILIGLERNTYIGNSMSSLRTLPPSRHEAIGSINDAIRQQHSLLPCIGPAELRAPLSERRSVDQ